MAKRKDPRIAGLPDTWAEAITSAGKTDVLPDRREALDVNEHTLPGVEIAVHTQSGTQPDDDEAEAAVERYSESRPWGRMDVETDREWELFSYYRSLGRARMKKDVAGFFGVSRPYITRVSQKRSWDRRIENWDRFKEQVYEQEVLDGIKSMAVEHARMARKGLEALVLPFDVLIQRIESGEGRAELDEMSIANLIKLVNQSARVLPGLMNAERLSRGLPTEITQSSHDETATGTIVLDTSDELAELVYGLAEYLPVLGSNEDPDIVDVRGREVSSQAPPVPED